MKTKFSPGAPSNDFSDVWAFFITLFAIVLSSRTPDPMQAEILRGGRLVYDIGWVGAISGTSDVADGQWHTAALVVKKNETRLFIDGMLEARRGEFLRPAAEGFVFKIGATATNFGGDYQGDIAWVRLLDMPLSDAAIAKSRLTLRAKVRL